MSESASLPDADPSALTIEAARSAILRALTPSSKTVRISTTQALGRILAAAVESPVDVPPFRASAMDGYALRFAEYETLLRISGTSLAGHPGADSFPAQCCVRVTTGARIPDDADTVVQQENVEIQNDHVRIVKAPEKGLHVRVAGSDSAKGCLLLDRGARLGSAELAVLAAHGIADVPVFERLKVGVFSTGDELVTANETPRKGQIFNANGQLIESLLQSTALTILDLGIVGDTPEALRSVLESAADCDILISSGGVSVGDADHVREVLGENGSVDLWKIAMKPGRPLTFGFTGNQQPYFGLPGNPVSAAVTALLFVRPALNHLLNTQTATLPPLHLPVMSTLKKLPGRVEFQRGIMMQNEKGEWQVDTTGLQDSHVLSSLQKANCLIELSLESAGAGIGDKVRVYPYQYFSDATL